MRKNKGVSGVAGCLTGVVGGGWGGGGEITRVDKTRDLTWRWAWLSFDFLDVSRFTTDVEFDGFAIFREDESGIGFCELVGVFGDGHEFQDAESIGVFDQEVTDGGLDIEGFGAWFGADSVFAGQFCDFGWVDFDGFDGFEFLGIGYWAIGELADPDVSESDFVAVVLKLDRSFFGQGGVGVEFQP